MPGVRERSARRVYADASVFGGVFDEEFARPSSAFFAQVRNGRFLLVTSATIEEELADAPPQVRGLYGEMVRLAEETADFAGAIPLQEAYLRAGVVGRGAVTDALHVALATVSGCRAIVSWNFRHIVHFDKIPLYNGVNLVEGYGALGIHTPQEVIEYGFEGEDL